MCNLLRLLKIPMVSSLFRVLAPNVGALLSFVLYDYVMTSNESTIFNEHWDDPVTGSNTMWAWSFRDKIGSYWDVLIYHDREETTPRCFGPITPQEYAAIPF